MGTAHSLLFLVNVFLFALVLFIGIDDRLSFGELKPSWLNCTSQTDLGLSFSFPSNWVVVNSTYKNNDVITLLPPDNHDLFGERMTFGMEKLQSNVSLSDYSNKAIKILSKALQKFHLIDSNPFVISDIKWERILYTHEVDNKLIQVLQFWSIKDDYVYIISFGTTPHSYFSYLPTIQKIISNVEFLTRNSSDIPSGSTIQSIYQSPEGFVLNYPSGWSKVLGQNRVSFIANQDNPKDQFLERVDLYHYENNNNNLSNMTNGKNDSLSADLIGELRYMADKLQNFDLISVNDINNSGILGKELLYTYDSKLGTFKTKEIMIKTETDLFVIIFTTQKQEFEKFTPIINRMIDSFQLNSSKLN